MALAKDVHKELYYKMLLTREFELTAESSSLREKCMELPTFV